MRANHHRPSSTKLRPSCASIPALFFTAPFIGHRSPPACGPHRSPPVPAVGHRPSPPGLPWCDWKVTPRPRATKEPTKAPIEMANEVTGPYLHDKEEVGEGAGLIRATQASGKGGGNQRGRQCFVPTPLQPRQIARPTQIAPSTTEGEAATPRLFRGQQRGRRMHADGADQVALRTADRCGGCLGLGRREGRAEVTHPSSHPPHPPHLCEPQQ